jgi:hypothetical protein
MRERFFLLLLGSILPTAIAGVAMLGGCGGVEVTPRGAGGGNGGVAVGGGNGGEELDGAPGYVDPGCPDAGAKMNVFGCDPFLQNGQCPPGDGCYIFAAPPQTLCGAEVYGSACAPEGAGTQGESCNGDQDCRGGFTCVISGSGNQCSQLCPIQGNSGCPAGMVCEPIDVQGFGGCL